MKMDEYQQFCLSLPNSSLSYPFDETTKVIKVADKIFTIIGNEQEISLKCDPERAQEYRLMYEGVRPGYHLNKTHWNTIKIDSDVMSADLKLMILHSYESVIATFTKNRREKLEYQLKIWKLEQEERKCSQ